MSTIMDRRLLANEAARKAAARRMAERNDLGIDYDAPGSSDVRKQAIQERDASIRSRFVTQPWRDATGRLRQAEQDFYSNLSPELAGGGLYSQRKAFIDPSDTKALEADRELAQREAVQYGYGPQRERAEKDELPMDPGYWKRVHREMDEAKAKVEAEENAKQTAADQRKASEELLAGWGTGEDSEEEGDGDAEE